ncbi:MAG TPA: hypothetical protein VN862_05400 [Candidatus Acidoferrales bacterium]|nr:hypothetical protein [Candidatus Acidoferrales bacterium]
MSAESSAIRDEFRAGRASMERKVAACTGALSLDPADRAEILTLLAADSDRRIAERAQNALLSLAPAAFAEALTRPDAPAHLLAYCAEHFADKPAVADAVAANPNCTALQLGHVARYLSVTGVQAIMDDLDRLSQHLDLVAVLLGSAPLSAEQRHQLHELSLGPASQQELEDAVNDAEPDLQKRQSLLQRLAQMRVTERVQLAVKGGREERVALIRDSCKVVQRAVLQSSKLTDREVESFASMTSLNDEVLRIIATRRNFRKNYTVVRNLVNNSKTPLDVSLNLLKSIQTPDLKLLEKNKNIPETLRSTAAKMFRQRSQTRGHG